MILAAMSFQRGMPVERTVPSTWTFGVTVLDGIAITVVVVVVTSWDRRIKTGRGALWAGITGPLETVRVRVSTFGEEAQVGC
jgi:hypothetical protein